MSTVTGTVPTPDNVSSGLEQSQSHPIDCQTWEKLNQLVNRNYQTLMHGNTLLLKQNIFISINILFIRNN